MRVPARQMDRATGPLGTQPAPRQGFSERRARKRRQAIERLERRVVRPVPMGQGSIDPLFRGNVSLRGRLGRAVAYVALAVGLHAGILLALSALNSALGPSELGIERKSQKVAVRILEPADLSEPEPVIEDPVARLPEPPEPPAPEEPRPRQEKKRPSPVRKPAEPLRQIPADPVDVPESPPPDQSLRRRIVGLSFESTVSGAKGPAFAVGNTRMGRTAARAADPSRVEKIVSRTRNPRSGRSALESPNRSATRIPTGKVVFVKPKRLEPVRLDYPGVLKARGVEGNVVVLIRIDRKGAVTSVKVLKSSGYEEFDKAARQAALSERLSPATRNGEPVEYSLKYTYRFRIRES